MCTHVSFPCLPGEDLGTAQGPGGWSAGACRYPVKQPLGEVQLLTIGCTASVYQFEAFAPLHQTERQKAARSLQHTNQTFTHRKLFCSSVPCSFVLRRKYWHAGEPFGASCSLQTKPSAKGLFARDREHSKSSFSFSRPCLSCFPYPMPAIGACPRSRRQPGRFFTRIRTRLRWTRQTKEEHHVVSWRPYWQAGIRAHASAHQGRRKH